MNSPCKHRARSVFLAVWVMLLTGIGTAQGQDALVLEDGSQSAIVLAAGTVGTRPIQLTNTGDIPLTARLRPELPAGWSMLIPPQSLVVPAGRSVTQLLSFTVPSSAAAGAYDIVLSTEEDDGDQLILKVEVPARAGATAEWMDGSDLVRAGSQIEATLRLTNSGNASEVLKIDARSSLGLSVRVRPESLRLNAGESGSVTFTLTTNDDITSRLTHALAASVSAERVDGELLRVTLNTEIYPTRVSAAQRREGRLPATLTVIASGEDGNQAGQVELRIPETSVEGHVVEALIRVPDARRLSTFSQPDRYSLRWARPGLSVRVGDHNWDATDLLEIGSLGFGVGAEVGDGRWQGGGYLQRSRQVFPEQQQAFGFVSSQVRPNLRLQVNGLAKRSYEEGEAASASVLFEPGYQQFEAEVAQGWFGDRKGQAAQARMLLQRGQSSLSVQAEAADDGFLGAIRGSRGGSVSSRVDIGSSLRWTSQGRLRQRRYDLGLDGRAEQTFGLARTAITLLRRRDQYRASWTITALGQINNNSLTDLRREEAALESRLTLNRRRIGINALVRRGQAEDPLSPDLGSYLTAQASVFGSLRSWSVNVSASVLDGPTFYNPVNQERIFLGVNLGWDNGEGTRFSLGAFHSEDRLRSSQSFSMADLRLGHRFGFGHELTVRARSVRTAFDTGIRNASLSVAWTVPLSLPLPGVTPGNDSITGRVVDAETGQPVPGAIVHVDERSTTTDAGGAFSIRADRKTAAYLTIDRASIGFDRRPVETMPMVIDVSSLSPEGLTIDIIRQASIAVQVDVDAGTGDARQSALNTSLSEADRGGVLVEIRSGSERLRRTTDRDGRARFPDLVPGSWKVFIVGSSLPDASVSRPDTVFIDAQPASANEAILTIASERRDVRMVGSGGVSLSGGVRSVETVSVSLQRDDEPAKDEDAGRNEDAEPPSQVRTGGGKHHVRDGETLAKLADYYYDGSTVHWIRIWQANLEELPDPDYLRAGQILAIPAAGPLTESERNALREWENRN